MILLMESQERRLVLDVVGFVPMNPVRYFTLISSVHFSHFQICLTIPDPFLLMIMLQKMHSTHCVLNLSSVGTDLKRLFTTDFFLPGIVASLGYLLIIN